MNLRPLTCSLGSVLFAGLASAQTTQAVEWKVSNGGNGHWYLFDRSYPERCWPTMRDAAVARGGHLATVTSAAENQFLRGFVQAQSHVGLEGGPFLGATCEGRAWGDWVWVTGEPFSFTAWNPSEPNSGGGERYIHMWRWEGGLGWNDAQPCCPGVYSCLMEWDADCNADGIVDYGQIVRGELGDVDANGIPDTCERAITGVVPAHGPASGGTQVTMVGYGFAPTSTIAFNGVPAIAVTRVSDTKLLAITPAGTQGPVVVSVNGAGTPDAFFYTADCGSDLDQNGVVDTADLALILLDFGPCSAGAVTLEPNAATPFMLRQEDSAVASHSR